VGACVILVDCIVLQCYFHNGDLWCLFVVSWWTRSVAGNRVLQ